MNKQELEGDPLEAVINNKSFRISRNEYVAVFQLEKFNLNNIYSNLRNFKDIENLDLNFLISKNFKYLVIKYQDKEKLNQINLQQVKADDIIKNFGCLIDKATTDPEEFNRNITDLDYKDNTVETDENLLEIIKIKQLPNELDLSKFPNDLVVSIKTKFFKEEKTKNSLEKIENELEQLEYSFEAKPYNLDSRKQKLNSIKGANFSKFSGVEINFLSKADNQTILDKKREKIKQAANNQQFNIETLPYLKRKDLSDFLINKEIDYTPSFITENQIRFFENIKNPNEKKLTKRVTQGIIKEMKKAVGITEEKNKSLFPVEQVFENNIIKLNDGSYTEIFQFEPANYRLKKKEERLSDLKQYEELINTVSEDVNTSIFIKTSNLRKDKLISDLTLEETGEYKKYINQYNLHLKTKIDEVFNSATKINYYLVFNVKASTAVEAKMKTSQLFEQAENNFNSMDSKLKQLNPEETLKVFYNAINNPDKYTKFRTNLDHQSSFKEAMLPYRYKFKTNKIKENNQVKKSYYISQYANKIGDTFFSDLTNLPYNLAVNLHINTLNPSEALEKVKSQLQKLEGNKQDRQDRHDTDYVPLNLKKNLEDANYIFDILEEDNEKLFEIDFVITIFAENEEELKTKEKLLKNVCSKHLFEYQDLQYRVKEGIISSLPFGKNQINHNRLALTQNVKRFIPFSYSNVYHEDGIFYGKTKNKQLLTVNRKRFDNSSGFFIGVPGSGKSFAAKLEIFNAYLQTNDDIVIIDPEREYNDITKALGGETVYLSANSDNHINILAIEDIDEKDVTYEDKVKDKIDFIITFTEKISSEKLKAKEKSILDRCMRKLYDRYKSKEEEPLLTDLHDLLLDQKEEEAEDLAGKLELYSKGSLDLFAKPTNVETNKRVVNYDINGLRKTLKPVALTAVMNAISELISKNRGEKYTWIYIDEFYLLTKSESTTEWLFETWKRIRKYDGIPTGITQNIGDLLENHQVSAMLSNSEIKMVMKQKAKDRKLLKEFLEISEAQENWIKEPQAGQGLFVAASNKIPFKNRMNPKQVPELFNLIRTGQEAI